MTNPGRAPIYRKKSVTTKQMKKFIVEIQEAGRIPTQNTLTKDQHHNH